MVGGTTTERALREQLAQRGIEARIASFPNHDDAIDALRGDAIDAHVADRFLLLGAQLDRGLQSEMVIAADNLTYETYGLMLRRGDADFRQVVDATLARLYRSGEALTLYDRWFGQLGPPSDLMRGLYFLNSLPE